MSPDVVVYLLKLIYEFSHVYWSNILSLEDVGESFPLRVELNVSYST